LKEGLNKMAQVTETYIETRTSVSVLWFSQKNLIDRNFVGTGDFVVGKDGLLSRGYIESDDGLSRTFTNIWASEEQMTARQDMFAIDETGSFKARTDYNEENGITRVKTSD
jgi:hypothetical protein